MEEVWGHTSVWLTVCSLTTIELSGIYVEQMEAREIGDTVNDW